MLGTQRPRSLVTCVFFGKGYGDMATYKLLIDDIERDWSLDGLDTRFAQQPILVSWRPYVHTASMPSGSGSGTLGMSSGSRDGSGSGKIGTDSALADYNESEVLVDEGVWRSPLAGHLPEGAEDVHMLFVRAAPTSQFPPTNCILLHMPCTGDEYYESRLATVALPLLEHGIGSIVLVPPLYGRRRPVGQLGYYADNVADYMIQSLAVILESAQLLRWMAQGFHDRQGDRHYTHLGVVGFSWGGAMAASAAVMSRLRVACVPYIGLNSPQALSTGIIQWQLDWEKLMLERSHTREEAATEIEEVFRNITLERLLSTAPKPKQTIGSLVQVAAYSDYYVSVEDGQRLYDTLCQAVEPHGLAELEWMSGGHATAFLYMNTYFVAACVKAVSALDANGSNVQEVNAVAEV